MIVTTQRDLIRVVADRWMAQYARTIALGGHHREVYDALKGLNLETASHSDVAAIIGNDSWTDLDRCTECGQQGDVIIRVGEEPDYESRTAYLCPSCARKVAELVKHLP